MRAVIIAALTIIALALLPFVVQAQTVNTIDLSFNTTACVPTVQCGSIGTAAALCVPAATGAYTRNQITITNSAASGGNNISVGYNASITLNGVGTLTLTPSQAAFWPRGTAPGQPLYCIASGATTPAQIVLGQ
jgi:hypothetical protein